MKIYAPGLLENDVASSSAFIDRYDRIGDFQGRIRTIKVDGRLEYDADDDFVGTDQLSYTACLTDAPSVCDSATVTITVKVDPNKPNANPTAINDSYRVMEGQRLSISAPGFLANDRTGTPSNPLWRCKRGGSPTGDLDTHSDGSFTYTAERCATGFDSFTYNACYDDYPDMISNTATVTIEVTRDPGRPNPPGAGDDRYTVFDNEVLRVDAANGLLRNDAGGNTLRVENVQALSGLDVNSDGSFTYTPTYGVTGAASFSYDACFSDWPCVACDTANVIIAVLVNPDKPKTPPTLEEQTYQVALGETLNVPAPGVLTNVEANNDYTLVVTNYQTGGGFVGVFDGDDDGSFRFGNAPSGTEKISFTVCYEEWPDVCANGQVTIETKSLVPNVSDFSRSLGVATFYEITWAGRPEIDCEAVEPSLKMSCDGEGELNLLDVGISDNSICTRSTDGSINCAAKHEGVVYVECRDNQADTASNRELVVEMASQPVDCGANENTPIYWTYHAMWLNTWCDNDWVAHGVNCTGKLLQDGTGPSVCYEDDATQGANAQPMSIIMRSTSYENCSIGPGAGSLSPLPQPAMLEIAGNDGSPGYAFPLQACQGDCDDDADCSGDMICFQRNGNEIVPGCVGTPQNARDYCVVPPPQTVSIRLGPNLRYVGNSEYNIGSALRTKHLTDLTSNPRFLC